MIKTKSDISAEYRRLWRTWQYVPYHFLRLYTYPKNQNYSLSEVTRILEKKRS